MASNLCEVWLCVDGCGDYTFGRDRESAMQAYCDEIRDVGQAEGLRYVKVIVDVPLPEVVELSGQAPAVGEAKLSSVQ